MKIKLVAVLLTLISLTGCATSYQGIAYTGGYSETRLAENVFRVSFKGNAYTSRERAADFALLRSAELTLENGYTHFVIIDAEDYSKVSTYTTPTTSNTTASAYGSGNYIYGSATTTTTGGETHNISKPRRSNVIMLFKHKPQGTFSYNADFLKRELRKKYGIVDE